MLAPLAALLVVTENKKIRLSWLVAAAIALLAVNIVLSGFADERGVLGFLAFRLFEIPAKTAVDALVFWQDEWGGQHLPGATNLVFSNLFSLERVHLERMVFEYQFGPYESGTASANAAFFADAYVNFGYPGVVLTATLLGALLAYIGRSADLALRCLAPLIVYSVFFGSFFSVLFGNGLLAFVILRPLWLAERKVHRSSLHPPAGSRLMPSLSNWMGLVFALLAFADSGRAATGGSEAVPVPVAAPSGRPPSGFRRLPESFRKTGVRGNVSDRCAESCRPGRVGFEC